MRRVLRATREWFTREPYRLDVAEGLRHGGQDYRRGMTAPDAELNHNHKIGA